MTLANQLVKFNAMNYTLLNDFSQIDSNEWNTLLKDSIQDTPFLRYEYQKTWWQTLGGGEWQNAKLILITANVRQHYCECNYNLRFIFD